MESEAERSHWGRYNAAIGRGGFTGDYSDRSTITRSTERYQSAETDEERHEIALAMGKLDGRRHAEIYAALENE